MSHVRSRIPAPLLMLLVAVAILATTWALVKAPWQAPDETWHFGYAQSVAERGALPGSAERASTSSEQVVGDLGSRAGSISFQPDLKPPWSESAFDRWQRSDAALPEGARSNGGGPNTAASNPPLYYLYEALPQWALWFGDVFDRLFAMRVWSALLLLVAVTATWLLAGELFGSNRMLQFGAAAVVGLQPMATFMSTAINPDSMLLALWSLGLWIGVRILRRGISVRWGAALAIVAAATALTKATGYIMVVAAAGVIAYALWRQRRQGARWLGRTVAVCAVVGLLPLATWVIGARITDRPVVSQVATVSGEPVSVFSFSPRYLASYVWQFYLPNPGFLNDVPGISTDYGYDVWFRTGWAVFGWKEVRLPNDNVYSWLRWISYAVLIAAGIALFRRRRSIDYRVALFLAATSLGLVLAHHWIEFRFLNERGETFIQGRYFLPLLPVAGCAGAAALLLLPIRIRGPVLGVALAGLFALQVLSLGVVLERYYA